MVHSSPSAVASPPRPAAPADRPRRRRGVRGWLAAGLALASVAVLWADRASGTTSGESVIDGRTFRYSLAGPPGLGWWQAAAALALIAAAFALWTGRRRSEIAIGALLAVAGLACGAHALDLRFGSRTLLPADLRAAPIGATRDAVTDRLGPAAGTGWTSRGGRRLDCLVYRARGLAPSFGDESAPLMLCFSGERLVVRKTP